MFALGAFLIPYVIFFICCGIPVFFLETALGQFTSEGGITCWRKVCPLFEGIHHIHFSLLYIFKYFCEYRYRSTFMTIENILQIDWIFSVQNGKNASNLVAINDNKMYSSRLIAFECAKISWMFFVFTYIIRLIKNAA